MVAAIARRSRRFNIVGGVEDVRLTGATPAARFEELLSAEKALVARRQQQGLGTYFRDTIDKLEGSAAELIALRGKLAKTAGGDEKGTFRPGEDSRG